MSDTNFEESMNDRLGAGNGRYGLDATTDETASSKTAKIKKAKVAADQSINKLADRAHTTVDKLTERAAVTYEGLSARAHEVADRVDPMVRQRPYAALGLALGVGAIVGMLLTARAPRVIYLKSPRG